MNSWRSMIDNAMATTTAFPSASVSTSQSQSSVRNLYARIASPSVTRDGSGNAAFSAASTRK